MQPPSEDDLPPGAEGGSHEIVAELNEEEAEVETQLSPSEAAPVGEPAAVLPEHMCATCGSECGLRKLMALHMLLEHVQVLAHSRPRPLLRLTAAMVAEHAS